MRDKLLQIRITQDLKDYIFGCAEKQYISVSQYIINLILADMEKKQLINKEGVKK